MTTTGEPNLKSQVTNPGSQARPTIGLLIEALTVGGEYVSALWNGIADAARERDINLLCFPGGMLHSSPTDDPESHRNAVYDLVTADNVDGLIISGSMGDLVTEDVLQSFLDRYRPLPMVGIALAQEGIPSVLADNYGGMRSCIVHLTQVHGHRRIAFIRGPEGNEDAEQRYRAYTDVLTEYGLPIDPDLIVPGDFSPSSGAEAIRILLDERKVDFEAVIASDDDTAFGVLDELQRRGIHVPYDMVVVGFDDAEQARFTTPSLTTVHQPVHEVGKRAVETLLALLAGMEAPEQVIVPTRLVVRQSCGCLSPAAMQAAAGRVTAAHETFETAFTTQRENILFEMVQAMEASPTGAVTGRAEQLLDAFFAAIQEESPGTFLRALDEVLRQTAATDGDVTSWHGAISALRRRSLSHLASDGEALSQAEDLWQQARIMIGETAQRVQEHQRLQEKRQTQQLREVGQALIATFDMADLMDVAARGIPQIGIPRCYLALYEGPDMPAEKSRLILACDEHGPLELGAGDPTFPSSQLVPGGLPSRGGPREHENESRYAMMVEPLYIENNPLGFALFEIGPRDGEIYDTLGRHLSSALEGALLVQEVEERTRSLQEANYAIQRRAIHLEASAEVARAITSIFDMDQLLRRTVELIRDRFGFYHAGIFLLDETGEWAVLQEATGEAGAQMKAQGHRLPVGETSMVGWTALHHEPRVALYADEDAIRFANPLLPYTRSEMALPMMIGDRLLGVLNVQSVEEAAFDDDDVRALQTMANQVAVAIENARRVSDETLLLEATSPIYRISRRLAQVTTISEVANSIITSVAETGADGCTVIEFEFSPDGIPIALLYRGVWRRDREARFQPGMRIPVAESTFPLEMVNTLLTVSDVEQDEHLPQNVRRTLIETGVRALANIPLRARERVIGQVVVLRATPGPFSDSAVRLYEALSDQAAVALERAQLWEEAQRRAARERLVSKISDQMQRATDMETLIRIAAEELNRALGGSRTFVRIGAVAELTDEDRAGHKPREA